jgi:hypothetical protein
MYDRANNITSPASHFTVATTLEIKQRDGLMLMKREENLGRRISRIEKIENHVSKLMSLAPLKLWTFDWKALLPRDFRPIPPAINDDNIEPLS